MKSKLSLILIEELVTATTTVPINNYQSKVTPLALSKSQCILYLKHSLSLLIQGLKASW